MVCAGRGADTKKARHGEPQIDEDTIRNHKMNRINSLIRIRFSPEHNKGDIRLKKLVFILVVMGLPLFQANAVQLTQADCNFAIEKLKYFNAYTNTHPGEKTTFEEKATYAYAEACENAGLISIAGYLRDVPEASPEVTKFCQQNAKTSGEAMRCLATGKLDD